MYGKPFGADGKLGNCHYIWVKATDQEDGTKILELFNEEEEKIKRELMNKYFSTDAEKEVMVAEMVDRGELTKEEAYDTLVEMKHLNSAGFMAFKKGDTISFENTFEEKTSTFDASSVCVSV